MEDELGRKIMTKFVGLRANTYAKKRMLYKENLNLKIIKTV